jgi:hypothetical protein
VDFGPLLNALREKVTAHGKHVKASMPRTIWSRSFDALELGWATILGLRRERLSSVHKWRFEPVPKILIRRLFLYEAVLQRAITPVMDRYDKNTSVEITPFGWLYIAEQALQKAESKQKGVESLFLAGTALSRAVKGIENGVVSSNRHKTPAVS